jgi:3(or 17)beta-hydroxysteroid dehydrogenase
MNRVDGKVAIVTGGGRGIGRATAVLLAKCGAKVLVTDVLDAEVEETVASITMNGGEAKGLHHDVTNEEDWRKAVDLAVEGLGGFEILVNNAGKFLQSSIEETTFEEYDRVMRVNIWGVMVGTRFALASMKNRISATNPAGSIINLASVAGLKGAPFRSVYCVSKGSVRVFTQSAARECAALGYNIRVNGIYPGLVSTDMGRIAVDGFADQLGMDHGEALEAAKKMHLIERTASPNEIAKGIAYLASEDAAYVTGMELIIDGGFNLK